MNLEICEDCLYKDPSMPFQTRQTIPQLTQLHSQSSVLEAFHILGVLTFYTTVHDAVSPPPIASIRCGPSTTCP